MAELKPRNVNNEQYWEKRAIAKSNRLFKKVAKFEKEIAQQYRLTLEQIRQLIMDFFNISARDNEGNLSYQEAINKLSPNELRDFRAKLNQYIPSIRETNDPTLMKELEKMQEATEITKFQMLLGLISVNLLLLGHSTVQLITDSLKETFVESYYTTVYDLFVGFGVGYDFTRLDERAVEEAINYPYSKDMFSNRVWDNRDLLVKNLRETLINGLVAGESNQVMARQLKEKMDSNYKNSLRIIRTESSFLMGEASHRAYVENGFIRQYMILATPSDRTCEICMKMDGKTFNLEDKVIGKNYQPFHPNCRCSSKPHHPNFNVTDGLRWANVGGNKFYIPASMSMDEFKEKYLRNGVPN